MAAVCAVSAGRATAATRDDVSHSRPPRRWLVYRVERSALARLFIGQHVLRANDAHERSQ